MLLFWKLVDETEISKPQDNTDTFKQNVTCMFLSAKIILKETFQCETPCTFLIYTVLSVKSAIYPLGIRMV